MHIESDNVPDGIANYVAVDIDADDFSDKCTDSLPYSNSFSGTHCWSLCEDERTYELRAGGRTRW